MMGQKDMTVYQRTRGPWQLRRYLFATIAASSIASIAMSASAVPSTAQAAGTPAQNKKIEDIRDAIQAAHDRDGSGPFEGIVPFLADKLETLHEPRFPHDGIVEGAKLGAFLPLEHSLANAAIENRRMDVTFTVKGNDIVMKGVLTGKLRGDGRLLVHPVNVVWTIADGKIVRFLVDASTPDIKEGYRLQGEAYRLPAVKPLLDAMMATMAPK